MMDSPAVSDGRTDVPKVEQYKGNMTNEALTIGDVGISGNTTSTNEPVVASSFIEFQIAMIIRKIYTPWPILLGGFGNIATILVMRRIKDHNSSQYAILTTLAVYDLIILYFGALSDWLLYLFEVDVRNSHVLVCKLQTWVIYSINTVSAWLVTCMTVQKTMAVLWPHRMRVMCTVRRTWIVIVTLVVTGSVIHFHFLIGMEMGGEGNCSLASEAYKAFYRHFYTLFDMALSSFIPSVCQIVCDIILSLTLFQSITSSSMSSASNADTSDNRRKTASRTTVMVLMVSGTFLVLTLPVCVCLIWLNYSHTTMLHTAEG
ncbi:hypothetical protein ACOMHN_028312 [Nucella lapillus]